ncbi:MAG: hypothetical protein L7F77_08430 [Candidatus Magnetominusculus sp. LBB02]|nr:hypothetical protein [Candidatus Magnetominusculus sp. LBB02]
MGDEFWIQGDGGKFAGSKPGVPKKGGGQSKESVQPSKQPTQLDKAKAEFWDWAQRQTGTNISGDSPEKANAEGIAESVKSGKMDMDQAYAALAKNGGKVSAYQNAFNIVKNDMAFWSYYSGVGGSSLSDDMLARYAHGVVPGATDFVMNLCNVPDPSQHDAEAEKRKADKTIEEARKEDPMLVDRVLTMVSGIGEQLLEVLKTPEFRKQLDAMLSLNPLTSSTKEFIEGLLGRSLITGEPVKVNLWLQILGALPIGELNALGKFKLLEKLGLLGIVRFLGENKQQGERVVKLTGGADEILKGLSVKGRLLMNSTRDANGVVNQIEHAASAMEFVTRDIKGTSKVDDVVDSYGILKDNIADIERKVEHEGLQLSSFAERQLKTAKENLQKAEARLKAQGIKL